MENKDKKIAKGMGEIIKGFVKFQEDEQLKRAKEMKGEFEKLNIPTLKWVIKNCLEILKNKAGDGEIGILEVAKRIKDEDRELAGVEDGN